MSRGKKRLGFELELKLKFAGKGKWQGLECAVDLKELCDDGSDPDQSLYITQENSKDKGIKFRTEVAEQKTIKQIIEKCREILNVVRDEI